MDCLQCFFLLLLLVFHNIGPISVMDPLSFNTLVGRCQQNPACYFLLSFFFFKEPLILLSVFLNIL